jgi:hypothetical protein
MRIQFNAAKALQVSARKKIAASDAKSRENISIQSVLEELKDSYWMFSLRV